MRTEIRPKTSQKLLNVFLDADLHYQLSGTPHHIYLQKQSFRHLGETRRMIIQVAALGSNAKKWMDHFIEEMNKVEAECTTNHT